MTGERLIHSTVGNKMELSCRQRSILLGTLLGDGCLAVHKNGKNAFLLMGHGLKQFDWLKWKFDELKSLFNMTEISVRRTGGGYQAGFVSSKAFPVLTDLWRMFYPNRKKVISSDILEQLDDLALAVWFGDDGSAASGEGLRLFLGGVTDSEVALVESWFVSRNMRPNIGKRIRNAVALSFRGRANTELRQRIEGMLPPVLDYKFKKVVRSGIIRVMSENVKKFLKTCHLERCHKPFESKSRNQKYCSDECLAASRQVHRSRGKRRRAYHKDAPNRRAQSMSRAQAREFAINELVLTICQGCGKPTKVADIETHHRDGDPFHNNLQNFGLLCKPCHAQADVEWRKAKAAKQPLPECRKFMLVAQGEGWEVVSFNPAAVPDQEAPPPPQPAPVHAVHDAVMVDVSKVAPGTTDPYLAGIMSGGETCPEHGVNTLYLSVTDSWECAVCAAEEPEVLHVSGETLAEIRETGTFDTTPKEETPEESDEEREARLDAEEGLRTAHEIIDEGK